MRRLVVGDIHGCFNGLMQVLERAKFNEEEDLLIGLGDYADGWPDVFDTIDYLKNLPHFQGVLGNHDRWLLDYLTFGYAPYDWICQGGKASYSDYISLKDSEIAEFHRQFLNSLPYYLVIDDKLFIHGGPKLINGFEISLEDQFREDMMWDRLLFYEASECYFYKANRLFKLDPYKEVYIGHTTTQIIQPDFTPIIHQNICMLDQGAGWNGKLTVMDIDTKEYWQSDFTPTLYPEVKGR